MNNLFNYKTIIFICSAALLCFSEVNAQMTPDQVSALEQAKEQLTFGDHEDHKFAAALWSGNPSCFHPCSQKYHECLKQYPTQKHTPRTPIQILQVCASDQYSCINACTKRK